MIAGTLITIREGLEAFLIVCILVGYLTKVKRPQFKIHIWIGTAAALIVSVLLAFLFQFMALQFEGTAAELFEAIVALLAMALQDVGWLPIGTTVAWDLQSFIPNEALTGRLLHAFFGYEAAPTILMVFAYSLYALFFGGQFFIAIRQGASNLPARFAKP